MLGLRGGDLTVVRGIPGRSPGPQARRDMLVEVLNVENGADTYDTTEPRRRR